MRKLKSAQFLLIFGLLVISLAACVRSTGSDIEPWQPSVGASTLVPNAASAENPYVSNPRAPGDPLYTPTPDSPHQLPGMRTGEDQHVVQSGDTLGQISQRYNVSIGTIAEANQIVNIDILEVGQTLIIPAPHPVTTGPNFKLIPDSELVASPVTANFNIKAFLQEKNGYLLRHKEEVNGQNLSGDQIVALVARDFSVNPRILMAVLEYQSRWITDTNPRTDTLKYPLGWKDPWRDGLYKQLAWAANNLNRGFYWWRGDAVASWTLADGTVVPIDPTINAGTAAMQYFFGLLYGYNTWEKTITADGLFAVYNEFFGYPFDYTYDPVVPDSPSQPSMQLPFEPGVVWAFTGGPHGGWGNGSAWGAIDFAPFVDDRGCFSSDEWVVAMADGLIIRAEDGAVIQDLDSDGKEQTGWTILYLHIEARDRVKAGTYLKAGERIGHPSCEGGVTDGTHAHFARRYNGEWIPADQNIPFVLDGWVSSGTGHEYDGYLQKGSASIEAYNGNIPANAIQR